jgi:hypothetical protein
LGALSASLKAALRLTKLGPIRRLAAGSAAVVLRLVDALNRMASLGLSAAVQSSPPQASQVDSLWQAMMKRLKAAPYRSGDYIQWRYANANLGRYEFICVRRRQSLAALVVVRRPERLDDPRLAGLRIGLVVDLMVDPADAAAIARGLLAARNWARGCDCDAVLLTLSHGGLGRLAARAGYIRMPGNVHFLVRAPAGTIDHSIDLKQSWVTRGDAWGDDL